MEKVKSSDKPKLVGENNSESVLSIVRRFLC